MNQSLNTEQARFNMVEQQIRPWDVSSQQVRDLLCQVKREGFVPAAHKGLTFMDLESPLQGTHEQALQTGECMLAPRVEARILQDLRVQPHETVLEIGTGSGYLAALLSRLAKRVISIEINPALARQARANLEQAGIDNVDVRVGDGSAEHFAEGPFDVIVLGGSVAEVPAELLAQLKVGGRLFAVVGDEPMMRASITTRTGEQQYDTSEPWDTVVPRLKNFAEHTGFRF